MYYKNKGLIDISDQNIEINNGDVNLIEIDNIKPNSGFPSDTIGKSALLIIYEKDSDNKHLYILIDDTSREYYLRHEVEFSVKEYKFILAANQVLDRWWQSIAMEDDPDTSYSDITTIINNIAPIYNPDEVNSMIDAKASRDEYEHYFKRDGVNNTVPDIHLYHQFPSINMVDKVIHMTVNGGKSSNTDYCIWYHNLQGEKWENSVVMSAWRNGSGWVTSMRFGNRYDFNAEEVEIQHNYPRLIVRYRENGNIRERDILMNTDMLWKKLGDVPAGGTVNTPQEATDVMIVPRFVSCLVTTNYPPMVVFGRAAPVAQRNQNPNHVVRNQEVPLGFNTFIGPVFDFGLPCFFVPQGVDYGIHGTSYTLTSRSSRQLTFGPGLLSHVASYGRNRGDASINYNVVYRSKHYEVWWR